MLFLENLKRRLDHVFGGYSLKYTEKIKGLKGEYRMVLRDAATGNILEELRDHNIIVNSASILIARLLKDNNEPDAGISYLAVGTGAPGWNLQNPPAPTVTQTALYSEITRKAFSTDDVSFIDPSSGDPVSYPTGVVDFSMTFNETEAVGPLVEMSLLGGDAGDTPSPLNDTMVNYRTFPVINKSNSMTLTITFRITC
jgi:hypothetical protein